MMVTCLLCGEAASVGALCSSHSEELASCQDLTAEQVLVEPVDAPVGWLVDQWGRGHAIGHGMTIGRDYAHCGLTIMHHSVSARHARILFDEYNAILMDTGSLNGTHINGTRMREARLRSGDRVVFGEVTLLFTDRAAPTSGLPHGVGGTVPIKKSAFISMAVRLRKDGQVADLLQRGDGGVIRTDSGALDLAQLEFALLRTLIEEALRATDREFHFIATDTLLRGLDFRTLAPTSENLRELVRRIRRKLKRLGLDGVIESKRGVGYRLGWHVESSSGT